VTYALDTRVWRQDVTFSEQVQSALESFSLGGVLMREVLLDLDHWRRDRVMSGGGMFVGVGTQVVDLMLWLAGAPPTRVVAFAQAGDGGSASIMDVQARLANGATLSLTFNDNVAGGDFHGYGPGRAG